MNDERAVEAMAEGFYNEYRDILPPTRLAELALAALRAEGYEIYRPDDCWDAKADRSSSLVTSDAVAPGRYRLVPVGGDS